jgi:hypothetical protein
VNGRPNPPISVAVVVVATPPTACAEHEPHVSGARVFLSAAVVNARPNPPTRRRCRRLRARRASCGQVTRRVHRTAPRAASRSVRDDEPFFSPRRAGPASPAVAAWARRTARAYHHGGAHHHLRVGQADRGCAPHNGSYADM